MVTELHPHCAHLDIETTSLSPSDGELTVVGLYLDGGKTDSFVQLVGEEISAKKLLEALKAVKVLYTYNGSRFDLPYIEAKLGVDLTKQCLHHDLMYDCWRRNLYGGLKEVERQLGIERHSTGIDGFMAVRLWLNYKLYDDEKALLTLLGYNREDVLNLKALRLKLKV
ncbi:exonuclease [bacterium]|nr:MAG: exonuclease [bacterium]